MRAVRVYPNKEGLMDFPPDLVCFGKDRDGLWWFKHPHTHGGVISKHQVVEHEDRTITVSPSILQTKRGAMGGFNGATIHGYLERGIWRDC